jgi:hypothetical protein
VLLQTSFVSALQVTRDLGGCSTYTNNVDGEALDNLLYKQYTLSLA